MSYEEFKLQFAQMYEHYERNRTDNIADPAVRRAHPISTISGWDRERVEGTSSTTPPLTMATGIEATDDTSKVETNVETKAIGDGSQINVPSAQDEHNKSESTTNIDADHSADNVKCICDEQTDENSNPEIDGTDKTKPISSISNISQVYNAQLSGQAVICNGDLHADEKVEAEATNLEPSEAPSMEAPTANTSGSDALRKTLEIDGYDMNEDNKEIVDEIVKEILAKSETVLDECKRTLDEHHLNEPERTSPVIKDEEIELAVSEVARNIEKIVKIDADNAGEMDENLNACQAPTAIEPDDNQKTDEMENFGDDIDENAGVALEPRPITTTTDEIKEIVTTIVNDVIENCVNQTSRTQTTDVCDNEKTSINQSDISDDSINNNEADVRDTTTTNDSNDNAIISEMQAETIDVEKNEAIAMETETAVDVEETNEEIVKGIVDEIVDKCVEREMNAANITNNNANNGNDDNTNNNDNIAAAQTSTDNMPNECNDNKATQSNEHIADNESIDNRGIESNRIQTKSISTSTQVENNHFGKFNLSETHYFTPFCRIFTFSLATLFLFSFFNFFELLKKNFIYF